MANNPILILSVILATLAFEGLIFGAEIAEVVFDNVERPQGSGGILGAFDAVVSVLQTIWGAVEFFFSLLTFNIPGSPWYVRLLAGGVLGGGLFWSVMTLIRGN